MSETTSAVQDGKRTGEADSDSYEEYKSEEDTLQEGEQVTKTKRLLITSEGGEKQGSVVENISVIAISEKDSTGQKESGDKKEKKRKKEKHGRHSIDGLADDALTGEDAERREERKKEKKKEKKAKEGKKEKKSKSKKDEEKVNEIRTVAAEETREEEKDQKQEIISVDIKKEEAEVVEITRTEKIQEAEVDANQVTMQLPVSEPEEKKKQEEAPAQGSVNEESAEPPAAAAAASSEAPVIETPSSQPVEHVKIDETEIVAPEEGKAVKDTSEILASETQESDKDTQPLLQEPSHAEQPDLPSPVPRPPEAGLAATESDITIRPSSPSVEPVDRVNAVEVPSEATPLPSKTTELRSGVAAILEHARQVADQSASYSSQVVMARSLVFRQEKLREHLIGMRNQFTDLDSEIRALKIDTYRNRQRPLPKH